MNKIKKVIKSIIRILREIFVFPIKLYKKFISPYLPNSCRYYPTCSEYAMTAIRKHGIIIGICLGCWRILRCNPFSRGGYDPVP